MVTLRGNQALGKSKEERMAKSEDEAMVQLATRIPKSLHRAIKLQCVRGDTSVMEFVIGALETRLERQKAKKAA